MSTARPVDHLTVGYPSQPATGQSASPTATSPIEPPSGGGIRSPFGLSPNLNPQNKMSGAPRSGAGSPSHEMAAAGRLFSKRAREIQAQEGIASLPVNPWAGPPTSGNSTPLRENIPESPTDGFPDFAPLPATESFPQNRRARAGTVPSRFSPGGAANGLLGVAGLPSKTSGPTPSRSPFKSPSPNLTPEDHATHSSAHSSNLLSRLRAGSLPQRTPFVPGHAPGTSSPFGPSIFSTWNPTGRERGSTLASIASVGSNGPSSPAQSLYSREATGENDVHMRTLDYLGLAETPQPTRAQLATPYAPSYADLTKAANRFRSYSVNNKDKYADEDEDDYDNGGRSVMDSQYEQLQAQLAATNAAIHQHNMAVQYFATAAVSRPRARTAGVLDTPPSRIMRNYLPTPSRLDSSMTAAEARLTEEKEYEEIPQAVAAVAAMTLGRSHSRNNGLLSAEEGLEGPTSALWLGSIPTSTTTSTLTEIFKQYGPIHSARVLTHKNCGFVNYERVDSAIAAKSDLNGQEIFPGQPAVRINFAKPPSASNTPGHDGVFPSPSPVPFAKGQDGQSGANDAGTTGETGRTPSATNANPTVPPLRDITGKIMEILTEFGSAEEERYRISQNVQRAVSYDGFIDEIPPIKEPANTRVHDAPKLRDIRKRIDNQTLSLAEIENIAVDMLPEIAELSSDYLGNTVVQKLFEHCSDDLRDSMLAEIAPHMAEIGVHKNGTWAAQKIIEVCTTPKQMSLIVEHLRPYTTPLFLDQYGNYVLQGCLKFGSPYNDFIFETMMSRMWEIGQGRYGARAMRACLESHHATKDQQRMLAAAIATQSVQLATNANAALLLTWFLDTCTFPQRRTVLAPQLVPYLVYLCTHKVAYLTVLKVINQKAEPEARDMLLKALFFSQNDQILEAILADPNSGATFIFKVLTTPFFDDSIRSQVIENVKAVLVRIKAQGNSGYKRLMDEVGLSTRSGGGAGGGARDHGNNANDRQRPGSRHTAQHHQQQHSHQQAQGQPQKQQAQSQAQAQSQFAPNNGQFYNSMGAAGNASNFDIGYGIPRSESVEPPLAPQYPAFGAQAGLYPSAAMQLQYQQGMMARGGPPMSSYYPTAQFGGYHTPSPSIDQYRSQNLVNGSPVPPVSAQMAPMASNQSPYGAPGFGMPMGINGFGYGGMNGMQQQPYMQEQGNNRRGRQR
ncbi:Protein JSN1 [Coniochaeta hoffmannii]|uniref:Protein JSN1 n=1 Tax=Coniochaeta hoffmannii TaxID=91930 RepID=A0AA38VDM8_9PEZI|nr:Protein JSN1 [Coniochaeta hoffmannii]